MKKQTLAFIFLVVTIVFTVFAGTAAASEGSIFHGVYTDENTVTFDRCTLVKELQLPEGSDLTQDVTCITNGVLSFTITAPGYKENGTGKVYFSAQLDLVDMNKVTYRGIQLYQGETPLPTYLYGRDTETAYYVAEITSPGTFTIKFAEGSTQNLPIQGDMTRYQEAQKKKTTSQKETTPASPVPIIGIIAGLCATLFLKRYRS